MLTKLLFSTTVLLLLAISVWAQKADSITATLQHLPATYFSSLDKKITTYNIRLTSKTEKTLTKLSRWENKLHSILLKSSPATAERLFGNSQLTFTGLLQQLKQGQGIVLKVQAPYNTYRDNLTTSLTYIAQQKQQLDSSIIKQAIAAGSKMKQLNTENDNSEAIQQFIKTRKKQLMQQALQLAGTSNSSF